MFPYSEITMKYLEGLTEIVSFSEREEMEADVEQALDKVRDGMDALWLEMTAPEKTLAQSFSQDLIFVKSGGVRWRGQNNGLSLSFFVGKLIQEKPEEIFCLVRDADLGYDTKLSLLLVLWGDLSTKILAFLSSHVEEKHQEYAQSIRKHVDNQHVERISTITSVF